MVEKIDSTTGLHLSVSPGRNKSVPIHSDILMWEDNIRIYLSLIDHKPGVSKLSEVLIQAVIIPSLPSLPFPSLPEED